MLDSLVQAICKSTGWTHADGLVQIPLADGRSQTVAVEVHSEDGERFVRVISAIGPSSALDIQRTTAALRLNGDLRIGAFAIIDDQLALVATITADQPDIAALQRSIAFVAKTADRYEQVVFGKDDR